MLIGTRYADNKLYRGIKHYDHLPLTSGDLHEYADMLHMKNAYFLNNLLGSGTLNEPNISVSSTGISLLSPSIVLIDGDISLINSDNEFITLAEIAESGISNGYLCMVGWYQSLTASSTLRSYGGVRNEIIPNDILDKDLNIQVSTRYQLRWDLIVVDRTAIESTDSFSFNLLNRDSTGAITTGSTQLVANKLGNIRIATRPSTMDYALSDLYIVPLVHYTYENNTISSAFSIKKLKPEGASGGLVSSTKEPINVEEGTIWYNPNTSKFKVWVEGSGFVSTASDFTLIQYRNTITIDTPNQSESNVRLDIGIEQYSGEDILQVLYNGVVLTESLHYTLHKDTKSISLLSFSTEVGDQVTFIDTKLVDSSNIETITSNFNTHVNTIGGDTLKGHVNLTDSISPSHDSSSGYAATPKAVYESTILVDSVTNKRYKLSVSNGVLGIVEVSD